MIRFKHNILPVWFQFDGDEAILNRAKQSIVDDIKLNGLNHYTALADEWDTASEEEKEWDGSPDFTVKLETPTEESADDSEVKESTTSKVTKKSSKPKLPMNKFSEKTTTTTEKTAS
jgi:hypothetical protein